MDDDNRFSNEFSDSTKIGNWQENRFRNSLTRTLKNSKRPAISTWSHQQSLLALKKSFQCRASVSHHPSGALCSGLRGQLFNLGGGLALSCGLRLEQMSHMQATSDKENRNGSLQRETAPVDLPCVLAEAHSFQRRNVFTLLKICKKTYNQHFKEQALNLELKKKNMALLEEPVRINWEKLMAAVDSPIYFGDYLVVRAHSRLGPDRAHYLGTFTGEMGSQLISADTRSLGYSTGLSPDSVFQILPVKDDSGRGPGERREARAQGPFELRHVLTGKVVCDSSAAMETVFGRESKAICKAPNGQESDLGIGSFNEHKADSSGFQVKFACVFFFKCGETESEDFDESEYSEETLAQPFFTSEIVNLIRSQVYEASGNKAFCLADLRHTFGKIDSQGRQILSQGDFVWGLKMNSIRLSEFQLRAVLGQFKSRMVPNYVDFGRFCDSLRLFVDEGRTESIERALGKIGFGEETVEVEIKCLVDRVFQKTPISAQKLDYFYKIFGNYSTNKRSLSREQMLHFFLDLSLAFPETAKFESFVADFSI